MMEGEEDKKLSEEQAEERHLIERQRDLRRSVEREQEISRPFLAGDRKMVAHDERIGRLLRGEQEASHLPVARPVEDFETRCLELARRAIAAGWQLDGYVMLGNGNRMTLRKGERKISRILKREDLEGKDLDAVLAEIIAE